MCKNRRMRFPPEGTIAPDLASQSHMAHNVLLAAARRPVLKMNLSFLHCKNSSVSQRSLSSSGLDHNQEATRPLQGTPLSSINAFEFDLSATFILGSLLERNGISPASERGLRSTGYELGGNLAYKRQQMRFATKMGRNATSSVSCFPHLDMCLLYICPPLKKNRGDGGTCSDGCTIYVAFRNVFPHTRYLLSVAQISAGVSTSPRYIQLRLRLPNRCKDFASNICNHRARQYQAD